MVHRYRLAASTSAVLIEHGERRVVMLPASAMISTPQPVDTLQGLIEVSFEGKSALMFAEDIRDRGTPLPAVSA